MPEGPSIAILREAVQAFSGKKIKVASGNSKKVNFEDLTGKKILRLDRVSIVRIHHAARILK